MDTEKIQIETSQAFNPQTPEFFKSFLALQGSVIASYYGFKDPHDVSTEPKAKWINENADNFRNMVCLHPEILKKYMAGIAEKDQVKVKESIEEISDLVMLPAEAGLDHLN